MSYAYNLARSRFYYLDKPSLFKVLRHLPCGNVCFFTNERGAKLDVGSNVLRYWPSEMSTFNQSEADLRWQHIYTQTHTQKHKFLTPAHNWASCNSGKNLIFSFLMLTTFLFRCVSTSRFHKIADWLTDRHLAQFEIPQQFLKERLCMTMYDYVWAYMTMYDYVWLCMIMYDYVWLCMTMYD